MRVFGIVTFELLQQGKGSGKVASRDQSGPRTCEELIDALARLAGLGDRLGDTGFELDRAGYRALRGADPLVEGART